MSSIVKMYGLLLVLLLGTSARSLRLNRGAYENLVISFTDNVPGEDCQTLINNLKDTVTDSSQYLFSALDGRAYIRSVTITIPGSWPDSCAQGPIGPGSGERSDISIVPYGPIGSRIWTQQSAGCGRSGDQIYLTHESLQSSDPNLARILIKEFAKYRYGVFDEHGYDQDPVYPMCFRNNETDPLRVSSCSDLPVQDNGICTNTQMPFNSSDLVDPNARSSVMFAAEAPSVTMFCDEGTHDPTSPTKHNFMCERRSTLDVILQHPDFFGTIIQHSNHITNTTPTFSIKKQTLTRYVMIIEDTKEMMLRESWTYLRNAIRKWAVYDLPSNTEVGLIMANETLASKLLDITSLTESRDRDLVASNIPYTPGDSRAAACLQCAIKDAIQMLKDRAKTHGPASSVIVMIAPGMEYSLQVPELAKEAKNSKIRITTINYPGVFRQQMLDSIALETNGLAYTVMEKKHNIGTSLLTTYFELTNIMYSIVQNFYQGNPLDLPVEIHRRILTDDFRSSVTGSFVLDADMGEPARFALFTHNVDSPLIKTLTLWSPSQVQYQARSDSLLSVKIITIAATFNETGTWTYKVERFSGNPQPHFIQITTTPRSSSASVVRTRFWTGRNQQGGPLVLYAEVKKQERPVMGAKVEVTVTRPEYNGTGVYSEKFDLLDSGSGDPDVTKGDGIYTRYFSAAASGGPGMYTFEVTVTDNGNTAYAVPDQTEDTTDSDKACCGSFIQKSRVQPLSPFQRVLAPVTILITPEDISSANQQTVGRIGDLKAQIMQTEQKVKLIWTAPDMGGVNVARYEIKYAGSIHDITEKYETNALTWDNGAPFPQSPGSETSFTINFTQELSLLDKPLYFAIKAFSQVSQESRSGPISNWVRVFVRSPPPPSTPSPVVPTMSVTSWPYNDQKSITVDNIRPRIANGLDLGLQLILPIVFGVVLLALIMALYCYCCVVKRKRNVNAKTDLMSTVTIVPPSTNNGLVSPNTSPQHNNAYTSDLNDHHTVGVPIYQDQHYEEEPTKKRLSIVHQQEQQLIEELKQQQQHQQHEHMQTPNNTYGGPLSVISNNTLQRGGRTLSPYESWTASQLLHEHERRHSPSMMDEMLQDHQQILHHPQSDHVSITGQSLDHVSVNGRMGVPEHYNVVLPPPVPPLPNYNGYPVNYPIYGVHQAQPPNPNLQTPPSNVYQTIHRNDNLVPFNASLQGSLNSVNSGEKKRRNVTMV